MVTGIVEGNKMRILILGGDGMLGHQLLISYQQIHEVKVTLRRDLNDYASYGLFSSENSYTGIDVRNNDRLVEVFSDFHPEVVINAIGIIKQRSEAKDAIPSLEINALLPHRLALLCKATGARLIQLSTDCVFSGKKGNYTESDGSDAQDLYGKTKYLGELHEEHCVTLRTSIIGLEISRKKSLIEWFIAQHGTIKGFKKAIFSGFTTQEMSRIIDDILHNHPDICGLYNVSSSPISKYDLLILLKKKLELDINIEPDESLVIDRSLDASRFQDVLGYRPPSWEDMLNELAQDIKERSK
jgi:dTDP-4-dehydrorhamnose reductase